MTRKRVARELNRGIDRDKFEFEAKRVRGAFVVTLREVAAHKRVTMASAKSRSESVV